MTGTDISRSDVGGLTSVGLDVGSKVPPSKIEPKRIQALGLLLLRESV